MLGASGGEGGGGNEETANSQALSDLQSENRELRRKLETLEEKEKALEKAEREMNNLRREVETLRSENKRQHEVIRKITSGACAGVDKEVQTKEEGENIEMADTSSAADQESGRPGLMDKVK